jgi:hypothetical protein
MSGPQNVNGRVADIARSIRSTCAKISDDQDLLNQVNDDRRDLGDKLATTRLEVMVEVAAMSAADNWTGDEISAACKYAAKLTNQAVEDRTEKSVLTLIGVMQNVANPRVRTRFPTLLQICQDVWNEEEAAIKAAKADPDNGPAITPVRKWQSRLYHLVTTVARGHKVGEYDIRSIADLKALADRNNPDHDDKRIEARIKAMNTMMQDIRRDFGYPDIETVIEFLSDMTAAKLKASRNEMLAKMGGARPLQAVPTPERSGGSVAPAGGAERQNEGNTGAAQTVDDGVGEPASGAADLDDILGDLAVDARLEMAA